MSDTSQPDVQYRTDARAVEQQRLDPPRRPDPADRLPALRRDL